MENYFPYKTIRLELGTVVLTRERMNKQTNCGNLLMVVKGILIKMSVVDIPSLQALLVNHVSRYGL
jgi:hypothetical protein